MSWSPPLIGVVGPTATGPLTLTEPAGAAEGHLLVADLGFENNDPFTGAAGWLPCGEDINVVGRPSSQRWYIVRGASAPDLTWPRTGGSHASGVIRAYPATGAISYIGEVSGPIPGAGTTEFSIAGLTTIGPNDLLVASAVGSSTAEISNFRATNPATPSGVDVDASTAPTAGAWLLRYDEPRAVASSHYISGADALRAAAGATGNLLATSPSNTYASLGIAAFHEAAGGDTTDPVITGPTGAAGAASIAVNVAENTTACGTWAADESVTWSISGTDAALFGINASTGALAFLSAPDFEAPADSGANNTYDLVVRATDGASNFSEQSVAVNVTDVSEGGDTTNPSAPGTPSFTAITKTSCTVSYTAASDDTAVTGYEYRLDGGSVVDAGNVLTFGLSGQTPGDTVTVEVRAYDAAGNRGAWASADVTFLIYGLDFDDPALDLELGNLSGTLVSLGLLDTVSVRVTVLDPDDATVVHEATAATDAAGVLPRLQHASLDDAVYDVLLTTTETDPLDRLAGRLIMQATAP